MKKAELQGEELLRFRHGKDLFPYCSTCSYSARTPVTGVLGCTEGDDPEVIQYSQQVEQGELDGENPKCPLYLSESQSIVESSFRGNIAKLSSIQDDIAVAVKKLAPDPESIDDWTPIRQTLKQNFNPVDVDFFFSSFEQTAFRQKSDFVKEVPIEDTTNFIKGVCVYCGKPPRSCVCKHATLDREPSSEDVSYGYLPEAFKDSVSWDSHLKEFPPRSEKGEPFLNDVQDIPVNEALVDLLEKQATDEDISDPNLRRQFYITFLGETEGITNPLQKREIALRLLKEYKGVIALGQDERILDRLLEQAESFRSA